MPATLPSGRQLNPRRYFGPLLGETEDLAGISNVLPSQGKVFLDSSCVCVYVKARAVLDMVSRGRKWGQFGLANADKVGSRGRKLSAHMELALRRDTKQKHGILIFPSALVLFSKRVCFMVQCLISHFLPASSRLLSPLCRGGFRERQPCG